MTVVMVPDALSIRARRGLIATALCVVISLVGGGVAGASAGASAASNPTTTAPKTAPDPPKRSRADINGEIDVMQASGAQLESTLAAMDARLADQQAAVDAAATNLAAAEAAAQVARDETAVAKTEADRTAGEVKKMAIDAYLNPPSENFATILGSSSFAEARQRTSLLNMQADRRAGVLTARTAALNAVRAKEHEATVLRDEAKTAAVQQKSALDDLRGSRDQQKQMAGQLDQRIEADLGEIAALDAVDRQRAADLAAQNTRIAQLAVASHAASKQPVATPVATSVTTPVTSGGPTAGSDGAVTTTTAKAPTTTQAAPTSTTIPPRVVPPPLVGPGDVMTVHGIVVNKSIAVTFNNLYEAATAAGFTVGGGGYRNPAQQIELRKQHCGTSDYAIYEMPSNQCSPPTARPGQSMHEQGLAVDLTSAGSLITTHNDPLWIWLDAHAADYGFYNLASEPWHWSVNGR